MLNFAATCDNLNQAVNDLALLQAVGQSRLHPPSSGRAGQSGPGPARRWLLAFCPGPCARPDLAVSHHVPHACGIVCV